MNDTLCRGACDKGCADIMYMTIEYPNYPIFSFLTQPRENVWTCCNWEIQVSTSVFEIEFSPPQLNVLPCFHVYSITQCGPNSDLTHTSRLAAKFFWTSRPFTQLVLKAETVNNPRQLPHSLVLAVLDPSTFKLGDWGTRNHNIGYSLLYKTFRFQNVFDLTSYILFLPVYSISEFSILFFLWLKWWCWN